MDASTVSRPGRMHMRTRFPKRVVADHVGLDVEDSSGISGTGNNGDCVFWPENPPGRDAGRGRNSNIGSKICLRRFQAKPKWEIPV